MTTTTLTVQDLRNATGHTMLWPTGTLVVRSYRDDDKHHQGLPITVADTVDIGPVGSSAIHRHVDALPYPDIDRVPGLTAEARWENARRWLAALDALLADRGYRRVSPWYRYLESELPGDRPAWIWQAAVERVNPPVREVGDEVGDIRREHTDRRRGMILAVGSDDSDVPAGHCRVQWTDRRGEHTEVVPDTMLR